MADFCKQCSMDIFGVDSRELAGITPQEDWDQSKAMVVICEGCDLIQVDPEGQCATPDCMRAGHSVPFKVPG